MFLLEDWLLGREEQEQEQQKADARIEAEELQNYLLSLPVEDMNREVKRMMEEDLRKLNDLRGQIDHCYLDNQKLIKIMARDDKRFGWRTAAACSVLAVLLFALVALIVYISMVVDFAVISAMLPFLLLGAMILPLIVVNKLYAPWEAEKKEEMLDWASKHMMESYIFESKCIRVRKKGPPFAVPKECHYYIYFKDDRNRRRRYEIPLLEYKNIKEQREPLRRVYVLAYPRRGLKNGYIPFDTRRFVNESSIPTPRSRA